MQPITGVLKNNNVQVNNMKNRQNKRQQFLNKLKKKNECLLHRAGTLKCPSGKKHLDGAHDHGKHKQSKSKDDHHDHGHHH